MATDYYRMDASPKGICLIINNYEFKVEGLSTLKTGPADERNLKRTFEELDFKVECINNRTCEQMKQKMQDMQEIDHSNYDCFVCCISSHGDKTGVCGAHGDTVNISELQEYVYSTKCPSLASKPKVFFVDTCRGGEKLEGFYQRGGGTLAGSWITSKRDFLLSFAATSDNEAYTSADPQQGSVYFYHLTRLLELHGKSLMVTQILHKLNAELTATASGQELQTAEYVSTLAKDLYFQKPVQAELNKPLPAFCFHVDGGVRVLLSNNKQTAEYRGGRFDGGGIVMSSDPMKVNKLYEVQLTERDEVGPLYVGVVTSSPDSLALSPWADRWKSAVAVYSDGFFDHGAHTNNNIGQALQNVTVDSRVGVRIDHDRRLHLHVNGDDQGVVPCRPIPGPCWAMWELNSAHRAIKSLPVASLS